MAWPMRAVFLLLAVLLAVPGGGPAAAQGTGLFGSLEFRSPDLRPFPKWNGVLARHQKSQGKIAPACSRSQFGHCETEGWRDFLAGLAKLPPREQVEAVNTAMNRARYVLDKVNWGSEDYWAAPSEFFWKDGDCEDYAIAKYLSLKALGFPDESLRLVVVMDQNLKTPHAILAVYLDGKTLLLDNQIGTVIDANRVRHYRPIFSLSESGWWLHR